jgi:hypothetical protein
VEQKCAEGITKTDRGVRKRDRCTSDSIFSAGNAENSFV